MSQPNRYPEPSEVPEGAAAELNALLESYFGPIVATYTPQIVSRGVHPEHVKKAWEGVSLPVRRSAAGEIENSGRVPIAAGDAFNSLVVAGTSEDVLQYWVDRLPEDPAFQLVFSLDEGQIEVLPPRR